MSCEVRPTKAFKRDAKRLIKMYRSLRGELKALTLQLEDNPILGTRISENVYKIRIAIKSKGSGKRGGGRVITYVVERDEVHNTTLIYLLIIYDKSDMISVSKRRIDALIKEIASE